MGLDLYYDKATRTPRNPHEAFEVRADELDVEALDRLGFRQYLQDIPTIESAAHIVVAADQESLDDALGPRGGFGGKKLMDCFIGRPGEFFAKISQIERQNGLIRSERSISYSYRWIQCDGSPTGVFCPADQTDEELDVFNWSPAKSHQESLVRRPPAESSSTQKYLVMTYYAPSVFLGLYTEEVGYQRKGMARGFYEEFGSPFLCWRREDVERAAGFVKPYDIEHFRQNFLDNFEEGRGLFSGSY